MTLLHTAQFSNWARGHLVCRVDDVTDRFALTFDDGPNPAATGQVLETLARHGAHATFFMLSGNVWRHAVLARRVIAEGHEAALHGTWHWPLPLLPPWAIRADVRRCDQAIRDATGVRPRYYRPPFGFMMPWQARTVRGLGFEPVLGDVYPEDPQEPGVERIVERVLPRLTGGSILILHDGSPFGRPKRLQTVAALEIILSNVKRSGLRATTVADVMG